MTAAEEERRIKGKINKRAKEASAGRSIPGEKGSIKNAGEQKRRNEHRE